MRGVLAALLAASARAFVAPHALLNVAAVAPLDVGAAVATSVAPLNLLVAAAAPSLATARRRTRAC